MYGHAADFSWLAGSVKRDLSCTYLRFADRGRAPWGGQIALEVSPEQMEELQGGDTVIIKGSLLGLAYGACGAPTYVVSGIEEH